MGAPEYNSVNHSEADLTDTRGLFRDAMATDSGTTLKQNMQGTEAAKGLLNAPDPIAAAQGGAPNPMHDAIKAKYTGAYNQEHQALQNTQSLEAKTQYFDKLSKVKQAVGEEQEMNYQKALAKYKQDQARKAARAGLVGNVLGIVVGAVAGAYTGGAGAAAGYAAGNAAGNAVAGGGD